jgi:branched-chain amino acid transport system permease protein
MPSGSLLKFWLAACFVAIGFVLIYKTSGVLNFAQGSQLLFAALTFVSLREHNVPMWAAFLLTLAVMSVLGVLIERTVLRPLVNQSPITLFMTTLGLSYVIEGAAQLLWGTQVHGLDLGIDDTPLDISGVFISEFDLFAAITAASMVILLSAFFRYTRVGLAFRAVADNQLAALAVGLRLPRIWAAAGQHRDWSLLWRACCGAPGLECNSRFRSSC